MMVAPVARTEDLVIQETIEEQLVYDLRNNRAVCLNSTSSLIWHLCDGKKTTREIAQVVSERLGKPVTDELIWLAIDQLKAENLLSNGDVIESRFDRLTRREVMRKLGIASMVALPIVSSIVAPTPTAAQSTTCVAPNTCIMAGDNLCAGCIGQTLILVGFSSTDGSCTGAPAGGGPQNCVMPAMLGSDVLVTQV